MSRTERLILARLMLLGSALTLTVVLMDRLQLLQPLERWLYDQRARHAQWFTPAPTDALVHVAIDDPSLRAIGAWPWPRGVLADIIDELRIAGAAQIGLDVIFPEAQPPQWHRNELGEFEQIDHDAELADAMRRHGRVFLAFDSVIQPIDKLRDAAADIAFVEYRTDPDGILRRVQVGFEHEGVLKPALGAALASRVAPDDTGQMLVPWFGPVHNWTGMYPDRDADNPAFMPIVNLHQVAQRARVIRGNHRVFDDALRFILSRTAPSELEAFDAQTPALDDVQARATWSKRVIDDLTESGMLAMFEAIDPDEADEEERHYLLSIRHLREIPATNTPLHAELGDARALFKRQLAARDVLIGWTATGSIADFVPTSLHASCPGVVVHGVLYNAIRSGWQWRRGPAWMDLMITLALGLITTVLVARLSPLRGSIAAGALLVGYAAINALLLFDYANYVVAMASPLCAVGVVWMGGMTGRFTLERAERARIVRRFQSYVDPALVHYVLEHPEQARLEGRKEELTVIFTDLVGFTTLTEQLQERSVAILGEYLAAMVKVIRARGGYVNKFIGDGIMCFFGAPQHQPDHARRAVDAAVELQRELTRLNKSFEARGLPTLAMRIGLCTGEMVVGDAGPDDASDYTVLGDSVNLASRLESANKQLGTRILINERCHQLVREHFLIRPIARLQVKGKKQAVTVYEPLARLDQTDSGLEQRARIMSEVYQHFVAGDFDQALAGTEPLRAYARDKTLAAFYHLRCEAMRSMPTPPDFTGEVILTEK